MRQQHDYAGAVRLYREATDIARSLGDQESVAIGLLNLAIVAIERESVPEARPLLREALLAAVATRSQIVGQAALDVMAGYAVTTDCQEDSAQFFGAAEEQAQRSGLRRDSADADFLLPRVEKCRVSLGADRFAHAQAEGARWGYEQALKRALERLA